MRNARLPQRIAQVQAQLSSKLAQELRIPASSVDYDYLAFLTMVGESGNIAQDYDVSVYDLPDRLQPYATRRYNAYTGARIWIPGWRPSPPGGTPRWSPSAEAKDIQGRIETAKPLVIAGGFATAGILGTALYFLLRGKSAPADGSIDPVDSGAAPALSPRRARALELVAGVVPSKYGDEKFTTLAPSYKADDPKLPASFTTCGYLVCYVAAKLGLTGMITRCGTNGVRDAGKTAGAWVDAIPGGDARPSPGDFYCIVSPDGTGVIHVGIIINASGAIWKTADSGQGTRGAGQQALYVDRPYDTAAGTLGGTGTTGRKLGGWCNLDKMTPLAAA